MSWLLVPCLVALRGEFDILNPARDRSSDGSKGDLRHQDISSDHNPDETGDTPYEDADSINEVHAIDVDETGPWPRGRDFDDCIEIIRLRHQRGDDNRLQNIIRNRRIASRSWGWTWRPYTGSNPHDKHGHFSARYTTAQESDMRPWGLLRRETDDVDEADIEAIANRVMAKLTTKLETAASEAVPDDAIVRNLIRIPWQYPGMLERFTKMEAALEDIQDRLPPAPAS